MNEDRHLASQRKQPFISCNLPSTQRQDIFPFPGISSAPSKPRETAQAVTLVGSCETPHGGRLRIHHCRERKNKRSADYLPVLVNHPFSFQEVSTKGEEHHALSKRRNLSGVLVLKFDAFSDYPSRQTRRFSLTTFLSMADSRNGVRNRDWDLMPPDDRPEDTIQH